MPDDTVISLSDINRTFTLGDSKVYALRHVDLKINRGEYISVMGPSGSGKSTLLNLIGLLDRADSGIYQLEKRDVTTLDSDELAKVRSEHIGFIFQSFHLVPRLTAAANIELPLILAGMKPSEREKRVLQALKAYGLSERANHKSNELSGGQRQRVAIARATILQPEVLLADEPTGNLDHKTGEEVMQLLEALNDQGTTLIIVTHDQPLGARARRQIKMNDGAIVSDLSKNSVEIKQELIIQKQET
jgi:putative ABC transport system ATP-binding protein